ncbi:MAG: response regulator [Elusimicrobiota bacterium]|jgi:phosphoribosyl 1,2-cyclic phosphodiesterase
MKKIVVVDDDPEMIEFMSFILKSKYEVTTASDGVAGFETVERVRPDLVILDLLMPRMHGFEVCRKLRDDPKFAGLKILISSSKSYSHDIATAKETGADNFIVKPFPAADLLWRVEELIGDAKTPMTLRFWGTRGSIPSPGPATQKYGGNTPCVELRVGETLIVADAGSGIRELGNSLMKEFAGKPIEGSIFIGHTHWDHIQGFPFFTPLYLPQNKFTIYGTHGTQQSFEDVLKMQMSPAYFPVRLKEMASRMTIVEMKEPVDLGPVKVTYHYLNHPGITIGFRFDAKNWSVCYLSDHEPYGKLNAKGDFSDREDEAVARFVAGCDILISEAQYTDEEYAVKRSWGHSTFTDVLDLAAKAQVKKLALYHHDPAHNDEMMDAFMVKAREHVAKRGLAMDCFAAQEGMTLTEKDLIPEAPAPSGETATAV